jgi:protein arginine N-methyltransferase 3
MTSLPVRARRDQDMSDSDSDVASSAGSIMEDVSEPDNTSFKCLFCETEFQSVDKMFAHCDSEHKFPIRETIKDVGSSNCCLSFRQALY